MAYPRSSSNAYQPLANLQSEINGAKSQWESLLDRLINGYKDAYKAHKDALKELERLIKKDTESDVGAFMFIFSLVSVGFAGGFVGGLVAPWVEKAGEKSFRHAVREGVKDIAKHGAWGMVEGAIKKLEHVAEESARGGSPYEPLVPDTLDQYLDRKEEFDRCFGRLNEFIEDLKTQSDNDQWPVETGQAIQRHFWAKMAVLRDRPRDENLPPRAKVAKAAELLMWVQWADPRDWPWWEAQYKVLEKGPPPGIEDVLYPHEAAPSTATGVVQRLVRRLPTPQETLFIRAHKAVGELWPVQSRIIDLLGKPPVRRGSVLVKDDYVPEVESRSKYYASLPDVFTYVDLRKLRKLRVDSMPDFGFDWMKTLDFGAQNTLGPRVKFLDGVKEVRPRYKK